MGTPPEGPVLDRPRDTAIDGDQDDDIAHGRTQTPAGGTSPSFHPTGIFTGRVAELPKGMMVGEYQIDGLLGEGGMGRVYSATHPVIGKRAAVKVLHPRYSANEEVVERFVQEARAANQIGHPNIVDIFAFGTLEETGLRYFVMEWLKGETLYERLARQTLSREEMCSYVTDISHALEAAHDKKIIHRDLKPENVFLHVIKNGLQIKLLDFGIAKLTSDDTRIERTRTGAMMGTPKYIAPEQARGYAVDHRVDIYSLGVMLFEMVAGRLPFEADNAMDLVAMHLHDDAPDLGEVMPGTPPQLSAIVASMLSKDAAPRPNLARLRAVLEEIKTLPSGMAYTSTALPIAGASPTIYGTAPQKSRKLAVALGLGVVAAGGIAAVVVLGGGSQPERKEEPLHGPSELVIAPLPKPPAPAIPDHQKKQPEPVVMERVDIKLARPVPGDLTIDGTHFDGPPWSLRLAPGHHKIEFKPRDGAPVSSEIELEAGKPLKVAIATKPTKSTKPPQRPPTIPTKNSPTPPKPPGPGEDDFLPPSKPK